jgi:DNA-binding MarR family transcriptional regulator
MLKRDELLVELEKALRKSSAEGTIFSHLVAQNVGLNSMDMECLDFLFIQGAMTAGKLAELTGLTTGAITGLIDRLEKAGYVQREADPNDKRKVIIVPVIEKASQEVLPYYKSMGERMGKILEKYSDQELAFLLEYTNQVLTVFQEEITELREVTKPVKSAEKD